MNSKIVRPANYALQRSRKGRAAERARWPVQIMALSSHEKTVIERFLERYNEYHSSGFAIVSWPDELDRTGKAIDAVAQDGSVSLGIEHTILQPFAGEKQDSSVFAKTLSALDQKANLILANFDVDLTVGVGAVQKGFDWALVAPAVESWYLSIMKSLGTGRSTHVIPNLPVTITVEVEKAASPGTGHFFVQRVMPAASVDNVVEQVLQAKLPKLVAAQVNRRVLLLEKDSAPRGYGEIGATINALASKHPDLAKIDEIWVINTIALKWKDYVASYLVWPSAEVTKFTAWRHSK